MSDQPHEDEAQWADGCLGDQAVQLYTEASANILTLTNDMR